MTKTSSPKPPDDARLVSVLHNNFRDHEAYCQPTLSSENIFIIRHFATDVTYTGRGTNGFLKINKDELHSKLPRLMQTSSSEFIRGLFQVLEEDGKPARGG